MMRNLTSGPYAGLVVFLSVILLYGNVATLIGSPGLASGLILGVLYVLAAPLLYLRAQHPFTISPILIWAFGFLLISSGWGIPAGKGLDSVLSVGTTFVFIGVLGLFYSLIASNHLLETSLRAIALVTLASTFLNLYEFFNPSTFSNVQGRSAGLYVNANTSAISIVLGMVLSLRVVPSRFRAIYMLIAGGGILLTFSRSGIICWLVAVAFLQFSRTAKVRVMGWFIAAAVGLAIISSPIVSAIDNELGVNPEISERLVSRVTTFSLSDLRDDSRFILLEQSWDKVSERPFAGSGTGIPLLNAGGSVLQGPHNMYFSLWIQHGLVGLAIFPMLIYGLMKSPRPKPAPEVIAVSAVFIVEAFFSHGMLAQWQYAVVIAIAARMSTSFAPDSGTNSFEHSTTSPKFIQ